MYQKRLSPLKTFLFYVSLFSLIFNFVSYPAYAAINHKYWESDIPYFLVEDIRQAVESASITAISDIDKEEEIAFSEEKKTATQQIAGILVEQKKTITTEEAHESSSFEIH